MPKVPSRLSGTDTLGIRVDRTSRRKTKTTTMTSRIEMISVRVTSLTDARMVVVRSSATSMCIAGGTDACSLGSMASTLSTVLITFAPGDLNTMSRMPGLPLKRPPVWMFSTPSITSATSRMRTTPCAAA